MQPEKEKLRNTLFWLPHNLIMERLQEEQLQAARLTEEKIAQLKKFKLDYECLGHRLHTLPHRIKHDVMVPIGKVAFMPGELVHTNEVMVLLGDNWFAWRSAKQAEEIVQRRNQAIEEQIHGFELQRKLLEPRIGFVSEMESQKRDIVEIKEDYDPEKERAWREQHRKNVQAHRRKARAEQERHGPLSTDPLARSDTGEEVSATDQDLWARLEELELQEQTRNEVERLDEGESSRTTAFTAELPSPSRGADRKSVRWQFGQGGGHGEDGETGDNDSLSDSDERCGGPATITFSHTPTRVPLAQTSLDQSNIVSPSDIYRLFAPQPKSILKETTPQQPMANIMLDPSPEYTQSAVSGTRKAPLVVNDIVERHLELTSLDSNTAPRGTERHLVGECAKSAPSGTQRVSRFKAERQKQQRAGPHPPS